MSDEVTSIVVVRTISASSAEVFAAWKDPALIQRWLAPEGCEVVEVSADEHPGGSFRIVVQTPGG